MADRLDALGDLRRSRFSALTGEVLSERDDPALDAIVAEAAALLRAPLALVSLVLERTQLFRAQFGLPADLALVRATDRDLSLCQFVVRDDAPLEIGDTSKDARIPRQLIDAAGVRAYLGMPVRVDGEVVGSLCVMDLVPRAFDDDERRGLAHLADRASRRLSELARERHGGPPLAALAARPALEELRNRLTPIVLGIDSARVAHAELAVLKRLAQVAIDQDHSAARSLVSATLALDDLSATISSLQADVRALTAGVRGLEHLLLPAPAPGLDEIVAAAMGLAHHYTKLIGGVVLEEPASVPRVRAPRSLAVSVVAATLSALARGSTTPLRVFARIEANTAVLVVEAGLPAGEVAARAMELAEALSGHPYVAMRAGSTGIEISLPFDD